MLLILGVDPGSQKTGYALIRQQKRQLEAVASGTIILDSKANPSSRLGKLQENLERILDENKPNVMAIEDVFFARNAKSALLLGQARGIALAAAGQRGLLVFSYPPATVKQAVVGHGRADKRQVQQMVKVILKLDRIPRSDEADAMAVAICHAMAAKDPRTK